MDGWETTDEMGHWIWGTIKSATHIHVLIHPFFKCTLGESVPCLLSLWLVQGTNTPESLLFTWKRTQKNAQTDRFVSTWQKWTTPLEGPVKAHPEGDASSRKMLHFIVRLAYCSLARAAGSFWLQLQNSDRRSRPRPIEKALMVTFHGFHIQSASKTN